MVTQCWFTVWSHSAGLLYGHTVLVYCMLTQCRFTVWSHSAGSLYSHTVPDYCIVTQCRITVQSHSAGSLYSHTVPDYCIVIQCRITVWSHSAGSLYGHTVPDHCMVTQRRITTCMVCMESIVLIGPALHANPFNESMIFHENSILFCGNDVLTSFEQLYQLDVFYLSLHWNVQVLIKFTFEKLISNRPSQTTHVDKTLKAIHINTI